MKPPDNEPVAVGLLRKLLAEHVICLSGDRVVDGSDQWQEAVLANDERALLGALWSDIESERERERDARRPVIRPDALDTPGAFVAYRTLPRRSLGDLEPSVFWRFLGTWFSDAAILVDWKLSELHDGSFTIDPTQLTSVGTEALPGDFAVRLEWPLVSRYG